MILNGAVQARERREVTNASRDSRTARFTLRVSFLVDQAGYKQPISEGLSLFLETATAVSRRMRWLLVTTVLLSGCTPTVEEQPPPRIPPGELRTASLVREGMSLMRSGRAGEALGRFYQAHYLYPDLDNLRRNVVGALIAVGATTEAREHVRELDDEDDSLLIEVRILQAERRFKEARALLERHRQRVDMTLLDEVALLDSLGAVTGSLGDDQASLCARWEGMFLRPTNVARKALVRELLLFGRHRAAEELLAAEEQRLDREGWYLRSVAAWWRGDLARRDQFLSSARLLPSVSEVSNDEIDALVTVIEKQASVSKIPKSISAIWPSEVKR